ncbi:replication initiation factor domain-containing protein, partial [Limnohabitans sp.]
VSPYYVEQNENKDLGIGGNAPPASNTGGTPDLAQPKTYTIFNNHGSMLRLPSDFNSLLPELEILRRIEAPENSAFIDTVSITFKSKAYFQAFPDSIAITSDGTDIVSDISMRLEEIFGFAVTAKRSRGINNYTHAYDLGNDWGHIAIGGIFQRDSIQIYINGQGCLSAKQGWEYRLFEYATKVDGTITRIDVAHDSFDGSYTVDKAVQSHIDGEFKTKNAPNNLRSKQEGCWNYEALGLENTGRSYYIGERKSGKMIRVYEKGYEIAGKLNKHKETAEIFKNEFSQWVRVELELGNQNRVIPLDILLHPEQYLAGSAPALAFISEEQKISKVRKKTVKATVESSKTWIKKQCGKWLYVFQEMECTNEAGLVDEKKLVQMIKSLMLEEIPRAFKMPDYQCSAPQMDFINFNDKKEDETEADWIDRTFPALGKKMNGLINSAKMRGKKYDVINDENWNHFDFVDV